MLMVTVFTTVATAPVYSQSQQIQDDDELEVEDDMGLPDDPDPVDTPIDGGLTLLLAAGAGYGVKKYRDGRKKNKG